MFITICYIYLSYINSKLTKKRLSDLVDMYCKHVAKSTLLIQRVVLSKSLGRMPRILKPGSLSISGFCDVGVDSIELRTLMELGGKQVLQIQPKQYVKLSEDWTLFIGSSSPKVNMLPVKITKDSEMYLLIEATPPHQDVNGQIHLREVPSEKAVKLSRLTKPIAWKHGEPFGIVVKASIEQCAKTGLAFLDGVLELDDGLLVENIATIGISGKAQSLLERKASLQVLSQNHLSSLEEDQPSTATSTHKLTQSQQDFICLGQQISNSDATDFNITSPERIKLTESQTTKTTSFYDQRPGKYRVPNVLVYTGSDDSEPDHYMMVKKMLHQCLHSNHYVIYHLTNQQMMNHPWTDNSALLVLSSENDIPNLPEVSNKLEYYLSKGGKILSFSSSLYLPNGINLIKHNWNNPIIDINYIDGSKESTFLECLHQEYLIDINKETDETDLTVLARFEGQPVILEVKSKEHGFFILCQVRLDIDYSSIKKINSDEFLKLKKSNETRNKVLLDIFTRLGMVCALEDIPEITPCYLLAKSERLKKSFLKTIKGHLKEGCLKSRLTDLQFDTVSFDREINSDSMSVITDGNPGSSNFDLAAYHKHLHSKVLGNLVLYSQVITTTMNMFEGFMFHVEENVGTVAIATIMTKGRGRGGNSWIAPKGCAMFSAHVRVAINSHIGQRLPFLQHIASFAVVEAVRSLPGYEKIDLRLKWPNDIYYGNKMKLGGVIVNSSCWENKFHAIIGCGFNVNNSDPTICINDLIARHNQENGTNLLPLTRELFIARTLTCMERIIDHFQRFGKDHFLSGYYKRWLHSGVKVHLETENGPEVDVVGLDEMGFLAVKNHSGQVVSVQPDGNSFDMMKNLLVTKERK